MSVDAPAACPVCLRGRVAAPTAFTRSTLQCVQHIDEEEHPREHFRCLPAVWTGLHSQRAAWNPGRVQPLRFGVQCGHSRGQPCPARPVQPAPPGPPSPQSRAALTSLERTLAEPSPTLPRRSYKPAKPARTFPCVATAQYSVDQEKGTPGHSQNAFPDWHARDDRPDADRDAPRHRWPGSRPCHGKPVDCLVACRNASAAVGCGAQSLACRDCGAGRGPRAGRSRWDFWLHCRAWEATLATDAPRWCSPHLAQLPRANGAAAWQRDRSPTPSRFPPNVENSRVANLPPAAGACPVEWAFPRSLPFPGYRSAASSTQPVSHDHATHPRHQRPAVCQWPHPSGPFGRVSPDRHLGPLPEAARPPLRLYLRRRHARHGDHDQCAQGRDFRGRADRPHARGPSGRLHAIRHRVRQLRQHEQRRDSRRSATTSGPRCAGPT